MSISDLIRFTENHLSSLNNSLAHAFATGNDAEVNRINAKIVETEATLTTLRSNA